MDDIKITTGMGGGPSGQAPQPPASPAPEMAQPEFLGAENLGPSPIPPGVEQKGGSLKTIAFVLVGLILVGAVGALGYFVIYPIAFPPEAPINQPPINTAPTVVAHTSFLVVPPAAESSVLLADTNYLTIANALQNEAFSQLADGQYKEVRISDSKGQVAFPRFLSGLAPAFSALGVRDWLKDDFTALLYYDASGAWPIYVAALKDGITPESVRASIQQVEGVWDLANFYLTSPGTFGGFKDGKLNSYSTRYNVGSQPGASFNYGVMGNYLIISTSFNGLKGALPLLGL